MAVTGETTRIVGILGSTRRDGPWQPSSTTQAVAVLGSCKLDLRQATIDSPVEIAATAVFGAVDIIVRPDTEVALSGVAIVGSKDIKGTPPKGGAGDAICVKAFSLFGGVSVTRKAQSSG